MIEGNFTINLIVYLGGEPMATVIEVIQSCNVRGVRESAVRLKKKARTVGRTQFSMNSCYANQSRQRLYFVSNPKSGSHGFGRVIGRDDGVLLFSQTILRLFGETTSPRYVLL